MTTTGDNIMATNKEVRKEGTLWYVYSNAGMKLTKGYPTEEKALERLAQIENFKNKGAIEGSFVARAIPNDPRNSPFIANATYNPKGVEANTIIDKNIIGDVNE